MREVIIKYECATPACSTKPSAPYPTSTSSSSVGTGEFYESVPEHVRQRGPWQGQHRGELANLNTQYLLDIEEQGYSLVRCERAVFKPKAH